MSAHDKAEFLKQVLKEGEEYAGIALGKDGKPDTHVILLPGQKEDVTHAEAVAFAASIGGELPTRQEQSLLFANLKEKFDQRAYWSGETHVEDSAYAWFQRFFSGGQYGLRKDYKLRGVAIRRSFI